MDDEVTKHTRKIYRIIRDPGHAFLEKARDIIIEILIIVFAVTLSIWLHNWSDHRHEQKQTDEFLAGIRADLGKDIDTMEANRQTFLEEGSYFQFLKDINRTKAIDTIEEGHISGHLYFQMRVTHVNIARYDGFKSSGKLGTIEDDSLRQAILIYYQQTVPSVNDIEKLVNDLQRQLMDAQINRPEDQSIRAFAKSNKVITLLEFTMDNLPSAIDEYADAERQARKIIGMIDGYLKDR